jgi:tetratricopeptide (TPR) repeat protein
MRRRPDKRPERASCGADRPLLRPLAILIGLVLIAGCAGFERKPAQKRLPPRTHKVQPKTPGEAAPERQLPKDVMRPAAPAAAATPARTASDRLVEKGTSFLDAKDYERAQSAFREAVNVDPQNGPAYYYLAFAQSRLGNATTAAGLLDKAEALLNGDGEWAEKIDALRAELGSLPSKPVLPSPIDRAF